MTSSLFRYQGRSMWPRFQDDDLLEVAPTTLTRVRIGDCVVLQGAEGIFIAHRVIGLRHGLRTRGDALKHADDADPTTLPLVGRVVACHRMGRRSVVAGGWRGLLAGRFYHYVGRIDPHRDGRGGRLGRLVRCCCAPLTRAVISPPDIQDGSLTKREPSSVWEFCNYVVAERRYPEGEWRVYWPWRLIVPVPKGNDA